MTGRRVGPLLAWLTFLVLALAGLHALGGRGSLAAPPLNDLGGWLERVDAATASFAVLRLVALALGWYLLATTVLAVGLRLSRADGAATGVEAATPAFVRRLVRGAVGITLAAGAMTSGAAAADDAPVTMRRLPDEPAVEMRRLDDDPPVTMRRLPDDAVTEAPAPPPAAATWTVQAGESFWVVAERVLADAWQRIPDDREIDPYWRLLVETNRDRLADPRNADLLFPTQVLEVPPPPPRP